MSRHHRHCHRNNPERRSTKKCQGRGFISRTLSGVAEKLGIAKGWVIAAFIILFLTSILLGLTAFALAHYWLKHPGKLEDQLDRGAEKFRHTFGHGAQASYAGAEPRAAQDPESEYQFAELRRKFEDLERRAGDMEEQVSSEEFALNRKFRDMQQGG